MTEVTISSFYSDNKKRHVVITKNDNTNLVYFYEDGVLVNTIRNPSSITQAEQLAEDYTSGFLNPKLILG